MSRHHHNRGRFRDDRHFETKQDKPKSDVPTPPPRLEQTAPEPKKRFAVVFANTMEEALQRMAEFQEKAKAVDRLNIVIRQEGAAVNPIIEKIGPVYCGATWVAIHETRVKEGWYDKLH